MSIDFAILDVIQSLRTPWADAVMPWLTWLADNGLIWIVTALGLMIYQTGIKACLKTPKSTRKPLNLQLIPRARMNFQTRPKKAGLKGPGLTLAVTLAVEFVGCNLILKNIFRRPRPCDIAPITDMLINRPSGWSFPSAHTAVSFAAATALFMYNKKWGACAYGLAALIGFSRLYLYVHFPTDVLFGAAFGLLVGWAVSRIMHKW